MKRNRNNSLLDRALLRRSLRESFIKLDPRKMVRNPIMFTVEAVTFVMLALLIYIAVTGDASQGSLLYNFIVFVVLLATLLFANFAEAIAEARGRAQPTACARPARRRPQNASSRMASRTSSAARTSGRATSSSASRATRSPPTARSSRDSPRSTKAPSRANRPR